jgi:serine/threonine protein kinase
MTEETIFDTALQKQTPSERSAYLDEACAGDGALRQRVEALLLAHDRAGVFLDRPAVEQIVLDPLGCGATRTDPAQASQDNPSLDFLTPSPKPGSLGRLDHYEVLAVVGQGGMGIVLKAFDETLHRVVAIKVMAPQLAANGMARKRFIREAQAAAAIRDEHVIDIHAVAEANGLPYLVMEYVSGTSLQDWLDQNGPMEVGKILRIGMQTATGLAKAHAQGLIHRDIKPANILLENGVQRVKITDFGLARAVDDASLTQSGVIAGTPQYMAPEQARGETVDHRADLFSLGSVLYAMCTGHPPFRANATMAVLKRVCEDTPRPVRELNPEIPDWLCAILDKLHAKDPAQRFQSAQEVAELLGQHLAHLQQPALVPLPPRVERPAKRSTMVRAFLPRYFRRVIILALSALALGLAIWAWFDPRVWAILSHSAILEVEVVANEEFENLNVIYRGVTAQGRQETTQIEAGSWTYLSPGTYEFRPEGSWRGWPENLDKYQMVVSPSSMQVAAGQRYTVKLFLRRRPAEPGTGDAKHSQGRPNAYPTRKPAPMQSRAIALASPNSVGSCVAFSPDGRLLAIGDSWVIRLWDRKEGKTRDVLRGHQNRVWCLAFSPDSRTLASGSFDGTVRLWDLASGKSRRKLTGHTDKVWSVAFDSTGNRLASASEDKTARLWDVATGKPLGEPFRDEAFLYAVLFTRDDKNLITGGFDGAIRVWDVATRKAQRSLGEHSSPVRLALTKDGKTLASGSTDTTVKLWDFATGKLLHTLRGHDLPVEGVAFSPDGQLLASVGGEYLRPDLPGEVRLWNVANGAEARLLGGHKKVVHGTAFSPDGKTLATASADGTVRLWDVPEGFLGVNVADPPPP